MTCRKSTPKSLSKDLASDGTHFAERCPTTATTTPKNAIWINSAQITKCSLNSPFWSSDFSSNSCTLVRMRHTAAPPPLAQLCSKHLKTSQSLVCCLLYQRVSGNLSESSLRYSRRLSGASMQINSALWQLFCCYLLWYSTSSSFRDLREAWPDSIYIPGSWKCHIGIDCSQPSFAFEY